MAIKVESFREFKKELDAASHWEDAGNFLHMKVNPDWDVYDKLEELGKLYTFVYRSNKGKMTGYAVFLVSPYIHCKDMLFAENDLLYVKKEYRRHGIAKTLIEFAMIYFMAMRVNYISFHVLESNPCHVLAEDLGFKLLSFQYSRRLN